ncbi:reticulon family protein, partial [Nitriliruptoraceae bacterium ZYF776]|nr:reticulon family protein [Profundirhabdus halotolerans]
PFSDWFIKDKEALRQRVQDYVNDRFDKTESTIQELKHYLFIENYIDSLKFGLFMYLLSILGGFFNLVTLVLIGFTLIFTVPKIYDLYHPNIRETVVNFRLRNAWITFPFSHPSHRRVIKTASYP